MTIADTDYQAHVDHLIQTLRDTHVPGKKVDHRMMVSGLEAGRPENDLVRDFAKQMLDVPNKDFDKALQREIVRNALGRVPVDAADLVEIVVERKGITAQYNGILTKNEVPYVTMEDGSKSYISPKDYDACEFKTMIQTHFRGMVRVDHLAQEIRLLAAKHRLPFSPSNLDDATYQWYETACKDRLWQLMGNLDFTDNHSVRQAGQDSLKRLAETCFVCEHGPEYVVAIVNKFIWQVKRKIAGLPIYDHLMPVILGSQGTGKSTLIRNMLEPVNELTSSADFKQITDDRNIDLWKSFVVFLDEMGWASKADMETVKNIITAPTLTRRPMRTNSTVIVPQNATFIGAANADELAELIRDQSGTRRFISITMIDTPDRDVVNAMDWQAVWQSVDHTKDDPTKGIKHHLQEAQNADRTRSPVEMWIQDIEPKYFLSGALIQPDRQFTTRELHSAYRDYEMATFPAHRGTSIVDFGRKMAALCKGGHSPFERYEGRARSINFVWRGPVTGCDLT